jgi:hypothetical protein
MVNGSSYDDKIGTWNMNAQLFSRLSLAGTYKGVSLGITGFEIMLNHLNIQKPCLLV